MKSCRVCLTLMTENYIASHHYRKEITSALNYRKPVIAVKTKDLGLSLGMRCQLSLFKLVRELDLEKEYMENLRDICNDIKSMEILRHCEIEDFMQKKEKKINFLGKLSKKNISKTKPSVTISNQKLPEPVPEMAESIAIPKLSESEKVLEEPIQRQDLPESVSVPKMAESITIPKLSSESSKIVHSITPKQEQDSPTIVDDSELVTIEDGSEDEEESLTVKEPDMEIPVIIRLRTGELFYGQPSMTSIGQDPRMCDVSFPVETISRHHADIISADGQYFIIDHHSSNGTYVHQKKLLKDAQQEIEDLTEISLSHAEKFLIAFGEKVICLENSMFVASLTSLKTKETKYFLDGDTCIGRNFPWESGAMSDLQIGRQHAVISLHNQQCFLTDQSTNGVFRVINNHEERFAKETAVLLQDGDKLHFGSKSPGKGEYFVFHCLELKEGISE